MAPAALDIVLFDVGRQRYGLSLADVERVIRAVAVTPLAGAPAIIEGVINLHGAIAPVLDLRARFGHRARRMGVDDVLIVARAGHRQVAIRADHAVGLARIDPAELHDPAAVTPGGALVAGIATLPDGIVLVHDLKTFLTQAEEDQLDALASDQDQP